MTSLPGFRFASFSLVLLIVTLFGEAVSLPNSAQAQTQVFPVSPITAVNGGAPFTVGDFNGDGLNDTVVSSNTTTGSITVYLNNGADTAPTAVVTNTTSCGTISAMAAADLNNDHKLDLVLDCSASYVTVLFGNGDGTFQMPSYYAVASLQPSLLFADLNGDGYPDVVVPNITGGSPSISVLLNKGTSSPGTLSSPMSYSVPNGGIEAGDFNGDGKQDILTSDNSTAFFILYGNGDGTLQAAKTQAGGVGSPFIAIDTDHDGITDVVYVPATSATVTPATLQTLLGNTSGQLSVGPTSALNSASVIPNTFSYYSLVSAGTSGDNNSVNLALVGQAATILLGDGSGGFSLGQTYAFSGGVDPATNSTGAVDLTFMLGDSFITLANNGDGTFQGLPNQPMASGFTAADFNGDGLIDIASASGTGTLVTNIARGDGTFAAINATTPAANQFFNNGDFDKDGKVDVIGITAGTVAGHGSSSSQDSQFYFYKGNGDGTFAAASPAIDLGTVGADGAAVGDFTGDGNLDVVVSYNNLTVISDTGLVLLPGKGHGTFGAPESIISGRTLGGPILTGDLNHDGKLDVVWTDTIFLSNGDGTFNQQPLGISNASYVGLLALADVNGDGIPDLAVATQVNGVNTVTFFAGAGDGTFHTSPLATCSLPMSFGAVTIDSAAIGDVNADGKPDLVVGYHDSSDIGYIGVFYGDRTGNFTYDSNVYYAGGIIVSPVTPLLLTRLNNQAPALASDKALDILTYTDGGATVLLNQTNPAPTAPAPLATTTSLSASASSVTPGQSLTLTATVTGINPTGTVTFASGSTSLGTGTVTNGVATLTTSFSNAGKYSVTAAYGGDSNNAASTSAAVSITVAAAAPTSTTTALSASATSAAPGASLTFTATVTGNNPTGTVTFASGSTALGTGTLTNGTATLTTSFASAGNYSITASYGGDSNNASSTSTSVAIAVVAPDFAISATPSSATITAGQSATATLTVTPSGGFNSAITFSCGTLPSKATCTFSPATVTPSGSPVTSTLTIATTSSTTAAVQPAISRSGKPLALAFVLCLLVSPLRTLRTRRRLLTSIGVLVLLLGGLISFTACGGKGGSGTTTTTGTPAGTYAVSVSVGQTGGTSHNVNFTLTVQ